MKSADVWEIRNSNGNGCVSPVPKCGYTDEQLASLKKNGYRLFLNGKLYKEKSNERK